MAKIMRDDACAFAPIASATGSKQSTLAAHDTGRQQREKVGAVMEHTVSEHVIRAFGNMAVSTGRAVFSVTVKGETPIRSSGQFVHVWQKNEGGWNLVCDYYHAYGRLPRAKAGPGAVGPSVLSTYAGTYQMEGGATMTVRVEGGKLFGEFSSPLGKSETPFDAVTDTTFSVFAGMGEATFVRSPQGGVREVIYLTDGPAERGVKVR
jgi:ketosteroid isomerase-like protein